VYGDAGTAEDYADDSSLSVERWSLADTTRDLTNSRAPELPAGVRGKLVV
jgi:hypothetical protein